MSKGWVCVSVCVCAEKIKCLCVSVLARFPKKTVFFFHSMECGRRFGRLYHILYTIVTETLRLQPFLLLFLSLLYSASHSHMTVLSETEIFLNNWHTHISWIMYPNSHFSPLLQTNCSDFVSAMYLSEIHICHCVLARHIAITYAISIKEAAFFFLFTCRMTSLSIDV